MPRDLPIENWALLLLFVMLATFISLTLVRRRGSRRGLTTREAARDQLARLRDQRDIRDSMDSLLVRLEEFSREVNAQLDTKFTRLELSIRDADQRTDRLRNTIAEHDRRLEALLAVQRRRGGGTAGGPSSNTESKTSAVLEPPPGGLSPAKAGEPPAQTAAPAAPPDHRFSRVYDLADAGISAAAIAEQVDMPVGEIELILNLRQAG